ncbi:MAG: pyroglutamyl-peptidase I [Opitutia bacterium Tous-C1TDCM]|nr:MAG: pyroglutamyl-peptidase I [Opitutae bacterium Tous-C1TDCM]
MPTVLLTGFEPFGGDATNPSQDIVRALDGRTIAGHRVAGRVLPCVFGKSVRELRRWLRRERPLLVICLGVAAGRGAITPERVAINLDDARMPDNAGEQPVDRPIARGGPAAYFSTLPVKGIVAALARRGLPAAVSHTAGTFVCNHVFYSLMRTLARRRGRAGAVRGGFIHVPAADTAGGSRPGLALAEQIAGIEIAIRTSLRLRRDARHRGGEIA